MMNHWRKFLWLLSAALLAAFSAGCAASSPETAWEAAGVSQPFYDVAEDFSAYFLTLDAVGAQYDRTLAAVDQYLEGQLSQAEAQSAVQDTLTALDTALESVPTVTLSDTFQEQLETVGISPMEYELFSNSRASQLQTYQERLATLTFYLDQADQQQDAREHLRFFVTADQAEQDSMRGYYYYGCFNYWFPWASEAERAYLQTAVVDHLESYCPPNPEWYTDTEEVEARVMLYLDDAEAVILLTAEYVGQSQADLYELEQTYSELLDLMESSRILQEKMDAMQALRMRVEALREEIAAAKEAGDTAQLAELEQELETLEAEYQALVDDADTP